MPKVSIIIPNYNHGNFLKQRIDSVLNQTCQDFELIILDDCSTDNSKFIIESYKSHPKVAQIIYNGNNSGSTFKQWEKGITLAKGKYVWIAESDDWCEPTLLECLVAPMDTNPDCSISYCQSYCVDDQNNISWSSKYRKLYDLVDGKQFIKKHMLIGNGIFNASMALWRKELFTAIPKDFLNYKFCGDWLFWIRLAAQGKVAINGRVLNYFRKHKNDISGKVYKSGFNYIEEMKVLNTIYKEHLIEDKDYKRGFKAKFKDFWTKRKQVSNSLKPEILKLFKLPASPQVSYLSVYISALWREFKLS